MGTKWGKAFWADLLERTLSALVAGVITLLSANQIQSVDTDLAWTIVLLPTLLVALKGLLANLANGTTGASLLPSSVGSAVNQDAPAPAPPAA